MEIFVNAVICFIAFSFCGWVCESVFCSIFEKKIVNRGFLCGPICPVYGFGGLIIVYLLGPLNNNLALNFFCGMAACTALEYVTSWVLEKLFNAKWWDYSDLRWNINGRVCLKFSLIFGLLSIAAAKLIYPPFHILAGRIPEEVKGWLAGGMLLILALDCVATVYSIVQLNGKLVEIKLYMDELRQKLESIQNGYLTFAQRIEQFKSDKGGKYEAVRQSVQQALGRFEHLTSIHKMQHKRIMKAFPNMKSLKYQEQFMRLRESLSGLSDKIRKK